MAKQIGGEHYQKGIQPFDYIRANNLNFFEGNVIKYVTRHRNKNGLEDIDKAIHYLEEIRKEYTELDEDFSEEKAMDNLIRLIKERGKTHQYKTIVTAGRGGMWAAANLAYALGIEDVRVIPLEQITKLVDDDILFVDDIVDTGNTITGMVIDSAVLYVRYDTRIMPSYAGVWINNDEYLHLPISQKYDTKGK